MRKDDVYRPRIVDAQIARMLKAAGVVVVEGAKACGKTTTALKLASSSVRLDRDQMMRVAGLADPAVLLPG
ncbi:MAG: ATP-binding protein, partial [Propionibacteriaceae bacterium]|nr:ATP-binding protein [Propionibacteriaceae bacterium]